jgi:tetratricopeptide (TPR) repeat protein
MARVNLALKVFICYAGIVMLAGAFTTLSRAGCAALAFGLVTLLGTLLWNRDFRLRAAIAILVIMIPTAWLATKSIKAQHRMKKGFSETGKFGDDRQFWWAAARDMWRENFWTGVGPAHFDVRYRPYRLKMAQLQVRPEYVHNDYLNTLADYGMIGFTLGILTLGAFWLGVVRIWRFVRRGNDLGSRQSTRAAIVLGACTGIGAIMLHCIAEFSIHIPALAILAVTLLAVVTMHWRFATERFWVRPGIVGRLAASLVCAALAGWLGFNAVKTFREQRALIYAENFVNEPERYSELLKAAYAIDPKNPNTPYWIGSSLRHQSWKGAPGYEKLAKEAIVWFEKAIALDPYTPHAHIGIGMCLHWLGRPQETWPYFQHARVLDANNYWVYATYGWHLMQFGAWFPAAEAFAMSKGLMPTNSQMAETYFKLALKKFEEQKQPPKISEPEPASAATTNAPTAER